MDDQGTERPGRSFSSVGPGRSAVELTHWHHLEQHKFVRAVSAALEKLVREQGVKALIIVAPPRTLADFASRLCTVTSKPSPHRRGRQGFNQAIRSTKLRRHLVDDA